MQYQSGLVPPRGVWWLPAGKQERLWMIIAFAWCMVLFAMMPFWHLKGGQNPSGERSRVKPEDYVARTLRFVEEYKVGEENGVPIVEPPAGADVYVLARMWSWYPALRLHQGVTYKIHLSSMDLNHGFSLYPANLNLQIVPGYDYALTMQPNQAGDYRIVCNEFCGIGHHTMVGKIEVLPATTVAALSTEGSR